MKTFVWVMSAVLFLAAAGTASASDPTGIYARIDKVVLEPSAEAPERVQVWGTFALAEGRGGDTYSKPVRGYLYYSLVKGKEDMCRKEWADLGKVAGKDQCVSFGSRYRPLGTVHKADTKPKNPDPFPLATGVVKVNASHPQAKALSAAAVQ
jgi:hypothetical protein